MDIFEPGSILAVYKPKGPSSNHIIGRLRRLTGLKRIGHAGTLDPLARGVLVVGIGREATKKLSTVVKTEKEYVAEITLGMESTTDDEAGEKTVIQTDLEPGLAEVQAALPQFLGRIEQVPPKYSAVKIKGAKAYRLSRRGHDVQLKPRPVEIKTIEVLSYQWPKLRLRVVCGPGTYIRSLARDLGRALGTGGYISDLERTRVGSWDREQAISIERSGRLLTDRLLLDETIAPDG